MAYTDAKGNTITARTLRGVLRHCLKPHDESLGIRIFDALMATEEEGYTWSVRGPRIVARIREADPDVVVLQASTILLTMSLSYHI